SVAGPDDLLGDSLWRTDTSDVVVVHAAHRDHRAPFPRVVHVEPGSGPDREPQAPIEGMMAGRFVPQDRGVNPSILQVRDLRVYYYTRAGAVKAANGVTFDLRIGERL